MRKVPVIFILVYLWPPSNISMTTKTIPIYLFERNQMILTEQDEKDAEFT